MNDSINDDLPWTEKHRPDELNGIISNENIIYSLNRFMDENTLPHIVLYGPTGTGKTTISKCIAKRLYGRFRSCMTRELNASNDRGVKIVRNEINDFIMSGSQYFLPFNERNKFKLVILDEFDSMTADAQGVLRRVIEENSGTTRFILICNDIDKVMPAILSRCVSYRFVSLDAKSMEERIIHIAKVEGVNIGNVCVKAIVRIAKGDMRSAINLLQHAHLVSKDKKITVDQLYLLSGVMTPTMNKDIWTMLLSLTQFPDHLMKIVGDINDTVANNSITIPNLLENVCRNLIDSNLEKKLWMLINLAKLELDDSKAVDNYVTIINLCSIFVLA